MNKLLEGGLVRVWGFTVYIIHKGFNIVLTRLRHCSIATLFWEMLHYN